MQIDISTEKQLQNNVIDLLKSMGYKFISPSKIKQNDKFYKKINYYEK